jgi:ribonuclease-3
MPEDHDGSETDRSPIAEWSFHVTPWESLFLERVNTARQIIRIACPFIKLRNVKLLLASLRKGQKPIHIQVLTRLNRRDCAAQVHDISALQLLLDNPVLDRSTIEVRSDNSLHAKMYIFDDLEVFVTSSNMSNAGFNRNEEIALASGRPDALRETVGHFNKLFGKGLQVTQEALDKTRSGLRYCTPIYRPEEAEPEEVQEAEEDDLLERVPIDDEVLDALDESTDRRLTQELTDDALVAPTPSGDPVGNEADSESRFLADLAAQYLTIFGAPVPSLDELATIHYHVSAYKRAKVGRPDERAAVVMEATGQSVFEAVLTLLVFTESSEHATGQLIATKVSYIYASKHLVKRFLSFGLARVMMQRQTSGENGPVPFRLVQAACFRLIAYLFATRSWPEFLTVCANLLNLREEFPYESYRHLNFKSRLQEACQALYNAQPRYELSSADGPDHNKRYSVSVFGGKKQQKLLAVGKGKSIKHAETDAAARAFAALPKENRVGSSGRGEALPQWVHDLVRTTGLELIRRLAGQSLPEVECQAVLIPSKHDSLAVTRLRFKLAVVGAAFRRALAVRRAAAMAQSANEMNRREASMNRNARVVAVLLDTPFRAWANTLGREPRFQFVNSPGPVETTLNALIGAVVFRHGFDACRQLDQLLFSGTDVSPQASQLAASSRLQAKIDGVLRGMFANPLKVKHAYVTPPSQMHNAQIQVTIEFGDVVLGQHVASRKKDAKEAACEAALKNPVLDELLAQYCTPNSPVPTAEGKEHSQGIH